MNKTSLSFKITSVFVVFSVAILAFLYYAFFHLFEQHMLRVEEDKATLILQTIEPLVAMNFYLGLKDETKQLIEQTANREQVLGLSLIIDKEKVWEKKYDDKIEYIHIVYPVKDPILGNSIGVINLAYTMDAFNKAIEQMSRQILYYLFGLSIFFLGFGLLTRYFLHPLSIIAHRVKNYRPGQSLDFDNIRMEPEMQAISDSFALMVTNIREYTVLLEQYKLSVDESSIVSKMDLNGKIIYVNEEYCRVCGYSSEELIGAKCSLVAHQDSGIEFYDGIFSTLREKKIWKGVLKNQTKNGEDYYVKSTIVPLIDDEGRIVEYISIQHDITKIIQQQEQILRQATDMVTGLPNRVKLEEDSTQRHSPKLAMISIDNYNNIKDYYGYDAAHQVLRDVASLLTHALQSQNIAIYKLASGEYALLADDDLNIEMFSHICVHAKEKIDDHQVDYEGDNIDIHATIGLTVNSENLLTYASLALQHAIETRKGLVLYEEQQNLRAQFENNLLWTKKIKSALNDKRFTLYVQPIVNAETDTIEKYECLVRLIDEDGKVISPFHFLDVAKKTMLYHQITQQVIKNAFEVFSRVSTHEFSINLSAEDVMHKETTDYLKHMLIEYDITSRVVLEIVESEEIQNYSEVQEFIAVMKHMGCKIAVDDFGTGYSNFSYLMQLNVDYIKVDGSLIKDIVDNPNSQIISATILNFSKELDLITVAEFVHNQEVLDKVKEMGFDYLQGYHLGEPVPIEHLLTS